jgi:hypothetical protein
MYRLLVANQVAPELEELQVKTCNETDTLWKLRDGLLLQDSKLYIPDGQLMPEMSLHTTLIKEAHK